MESLTNKTTKDLNVISKRLSSLGINAPISITREGTIGEYPSILIWKENLSPAMENLLELRKMVNPYYREEKNSFSCVFNIEVGYSSDSVVIEIKPRYSYFLESEREKLGY